MLRSALWMGFLLRLAIAVWNGFWGPSLDAGGDAAGFHQIASDYTKNIFRGDVVQISIGFIYSYVLSKIYEFTIDSLFLGSLLSVLAWLASASVLIQIMRLLSVDKAQQGKAMLIYALLPFSIIYTGVTLREAYQLLFANLAIHAALKIYLHRSFMHWFVLIAASVGMGALHGALMAFAVFLVIGTLILGALHGRKGIVLVKFMIVLPIGAVVLYFGAGLFVELAYNLDYGLASAIQSYQLGSLSDDARAHYASGAEISGLTGWLLFVPTALFQYLFEPMPWRISSVVDIGLLCENVLRAWLIWKAWTGLRGMPLQGRRPVLFVFLSYLVLEMIWAVGTVNWGTAARHHIVSMGLLLIAAFASASVFSKRGKMLPGSSVQQLPPTPSRS